MRLLPGSAAEAPLAYLPKIQPQPPEHAWLPHLDSDFPSAIMHRYGEGLVVYLPGELDRQVWALGHADFSLVLANALSALLADERSLTTDAPPSVQLVLNAIPSERRHLLHAINLTAAPRRPVQHVVPVSDITVTVTLPGTAVIDFQVLYGSAETRILNEERLPDERVRIHLALPRIEEYLAVLIETR